MAQENTNTVGTYKLTNGYAEFDESLGYKDIYVFVSSASTANATVLGTGVFKINGNIVTSIDAEIEPGQGLNVEGMRSEPYYIKFASPSVSCTLNLFAFNN